MIKALALSWLVVIAAAFVFFPYSNHLSTRIAAGIFIAAVIFNAVVEFGWLGGDKRL